MTNDPMNRLMANFSKGNFDVTAEEIFKPEERVAPIMVLVTTQQQRDIDNLVTRSQTACTFEDPPGRIQCLHCESVVPSSFNIAGHAEECEILSAHRLRDFAKGVSTGEDALCASEAILYWLQNELPEFVLDAFDSACVLRVAELERQEKTYGNTHVRTKLEAMQRLLKRIIEDVEGL